MTISSLASVESDHFFIEFGKKIQTFRRAKGLTQAEVAELCHVGVRFLSELENGKSTVEMGKVLQVIKALDLEFNLSDSPKSKQQQRERQQDEVLKRLSTHPDIKTGNTRQAIILITEAVAEVLNTEYNGVWFFNQEKDLLVAHDEYTLSKKSHAPEDNYHINDYPQFFSDLLEVRTLVEEGGTLTNLIKHEFAGEIERYDITSTLDSPIKVDGEIVGILSSEHCRINHIWASDEVAFHGHISVLLAEVLRNEQYRLLSDDFILQKQRDREQQALIMELVNQSDFRQGYYVSALKYTLKKIACFFNASAANFWLKNEAEQCFSLDGRYDNKRKKYIAAGNANKEVCPLTYMHELASVSKVAASEFDSRSVCQGLFQHQGTLFSVLESAVYIAGDIQAVLVLEKSDSSYRWQPHEEAVVHELSAQLSQLIINSKLKDAERKINEQVIYAGHLQKVVSELSLDSRIVAANNVEKAIHYINELVSKTLGVEGCGVWLSDSDANKLTCVDYYERSNNRHYVDVSYTQENYPRFFKSLKKEKTIAADDAKNDSRTSEFLDEEQNVYGIASSMDSAIRLHAKIVGILNVEHYGNIREWTADEIAFHGTVADIIGFMLANKSYRQQEQEKILRLEQEQERITRMHHKNILLSSIAVSSQLSSGDVGGVIKAICKNVVDALGCQRAEVWWLDQESSYINIEQGYDNSRGYYHRDKPYRLKDSTGYYELLTSGRQIIFDASSKDKNEAMCFAELIRDKSITAGIDVAIRVRGETLGLLAVEHCETVRLWDEDEVVFVSSMSDQITQALMNNESIEEDKRSQEAREGLRKKQEMLVELATHKDVINGNLQKVADLITKKMAVLLNVYNAGVWMFDYEGRHAWLLSSYILEGDYYEENLQQFSHDADLYDVFYTELRRRRTVAINDTLNDPLASSFAELFYIPENISSTLESAIRVQGKMVGAINLDHKGEKRRWSNEEIAVCGGLADIMAHAIMNDERKKSQQRYKALAERREEMDAIINGSRFIVVEWGVGSNSPVEFISENIAQFGYSPEDFYQDKNLYRKIIFQEDYQYNLDIINAAEDARDSNEYTVEYRVVTKAGEWRWIEERSKIHRDKNGEVSHYHGVLCDITERKEDAHKLLMLSRAVEHSASGVFIVNNKQYIEYVNPTFIAMTGYDESELLGGDVYQIKVADHSHKNFSAMLQAIDSGESWHGELELHAKHGDDVWVLLSTSPIRDDIGRLTHFVAVCEDITEHKNHQQQMEQLAYYDTLTGLENRRLFRDGLECLLEEMADSKASCALLFLDLDRFKIINDTLGHDAGDQLLITVAERLSSCVDANDNVARLGGDEFTIILKNINNKERDYVDTIARRIINALSQPIQLANEEVVVTVSIGVTMVPDDGVLISDLMKNADLAMYQAKSLGRNNYQFYSKDLQVDSAKQLHIDSDLRLALKRDEFILHYQPIMSCDHNMVSVEALLRWQHPQQGLLSPESFIDSAEELGLLVAIEQQVLDKACSFAATLQQHRPAPSMPVCINVSHSFLFSEGAVAYIASMLQKYQLPALALHLEIAESIIIAQPENLALVLNSLKALGIYLSVDDFGLGYSALNYLRDLPIDGIKIDQCFIQGTDSASQDKKIVPALIDLAHNLNIEVVAEGVETQQQLQFLDENKCDYHQGYLYSHTMSAEDILKSL
ncbi:EAL domain-containing protein [Dasania marina]|uniref:EAL domain-containing protein n=1 Tax=Dasania marina TaxID=471499 RepID=UPI0014616807|nr:EAL domain-containing protein [Dasania marina]